jgi:AsmA protein
VGKIVRGLAQGHLSKIAPAAEDRTPFTEFSGTLDIAKGSATNRDLRLVGPNLQLSGEGTFDLGARQMNYEVRTKVSGSQPGERVTLNIGTIEVPVTISGPWERPAFSVKGQEQLIESAKKLGKRLKSQEVQDTVKGLLGSDKEERARSREKARELLEKFLKKE